MSAVPCEVLHKIFFFFFQKCKLFDTPTLVCQFGNGVLFIKLFGSHTSFFIAVSERRDTNLHFQSVAQSSPRTSAAVQSIVSISLTHKHACASTRHDILVFNATSVHHLRKCIDLSVLLKLLIVKKCSIALNSESHCA